MGRFRFRLTRAVVLLCLPLTAAAARAAGLPSEPYRLDASFAYQIDRFNSPAADSLGLATTHGTVAAIGFDFRVMNLPMKAPEPPALHILGDVITTRRTIATANRVSPAGPSSIEEVPIAELTAGILLELPLAIVDRGAGAAMYIGYKGGLLLGDGGRQDFLRIKKLFFGFERTHGFFEGSLVEMAMGRDESYGRAYAAKRWSARFHVQNALGLRHAPKAPANAKAPAPPAPPPPLRLFADIAVDTDGGIGPDGIRAQVGLAVNAGSVLRRVMRADE